MDDEASEKLGQIARILADADAFTQLGMWADAEASLRSFPPIPAAEAVRLGAWCQLEFAKGNWAGVYGLASELAAGYPKDSNAWFWLGYSVRRIKSVEAAYELLKPVIGLFPENPVIDYNFACYATQSEREEEATAVLANVFARHPEYIEIGWVDEDLAPLRPWIELFRDKQSAGEGT